MKVREIRELLNSCDDDDDILVSVNIDEMAVSVPIVASDILEGMIVEGKYLQTAVCLFINMYGMTIDEFERVTSVKG